MAKERGSICCINGSGSWRKQWSVACVMAGSVAGRKASTDRRREEGKFLLLSFYVYFEYICIIGRVVLLPSEKKKGKEKTLYYAGLLFPMCVYVNMALYPYSTKPDLQIPSYTVIVLFYWEQGQTTTMCEEKEQETCLPYQQWHWLQGNLPSTHPSSQWQTSIPCLMLCMAWRTPHQPNC